MLTADLQLLRKSLLSLHLLKEHGVDMLRVNTVVSVLNTVGIDSRQYSSTLVANNV